MSVGETLRPKLDRIQALSLIAGGVGLAVCLLAALIWPKAALPSYLVAYLYWVGLGLGCIALTMLHHLVGGAWGQPIRRPMESGAMTLLPMALLFLPLALGLRYVYPWTDADYMRHEEALLHKARYLNTNAFLLRAVGYFAIWIVFAWLLNRWSVRQDATTDDAPTRRLQTLSGPGLAITFLTATFATIDWIMSLEPLWYSTIFGAMVIVGWGLETFAFMIVVAALLAEHEPMSRYALPSRLHDLGNLMLAFVMLWAYMAFSQFLIIWSGNLVEEVPWYLRRTRGGWQYVALLLILFHFAVPFFFLLFREAKRTARTIMGVAAGIVAIHLLDMAWLVLPAPYEATSPKIPWGSLLLVPAAAVGIGGIWIWVFLRQLKGRPLIPLNTPEIDPTHELDPGH